ncbi:MAG: DNA polymerase IV [Actinobacteria bacterium]|nr:DNA polymerase IV [Actinomycetota bacterium]
MKTVATSSFDSSAFPEWESRAILLVDLDAFFASVEQLDHPEWRGLPVIVGGDAQRRGVVSTCSYEARRFGVHSAMPSITAQRLCPNAIWTHGDFKRYNEISGKVMDILRDESPLLQQVSIDEAFLDVTPGRYFKEHPVVIANRIRRRVEDLGITCSIGVGSSKTVAKIASDCDKPNGITVVFPGTEKIFLSPLPVRSLSGIGAQSEKRLNEKGIKTLGELAVCDPNVLREIFGTNAEIMRNRCIGVDPVEVSVEREVKSVSNEMTFSSDIGEIAEIKEAIALLAAKVGRRLRRKELAGRTIALKMKYSDLTIRTARKSISAATDDETIYLPVLYDLIGELWSVGVKLRLLGVSVSGFDERYEQLTLLDTENEIRVNEDLASMSSQRKLIEATDKVKDRFGDEAVRYGRELRFKDRDTGTAPQSKDEFH